MTYSSFSEETHDLQTFLIVGPSTTNENADVVGDEGSLVLIESAEDTLEGGGDVGKSRPPPMMSILPSAWVGHD